MAADSKSTMALDLQLSDRELCLIGSIVSNWGSLEHEVFTQTLLSFDSQEEPIKDVPKAMNNLQFTQVLSLWKERVVDKSTGDRLATFLEVYEAIIHLKEPRDALVHGMWHWCPKNLDEIWTVRVKKREVITARFDADYLDDFALRLAKLNFLVRYPGGVKDFAAAREAEGFYVSREFLKKMTRPAGPGKGSARPTDA